MPDREIESKARVAQVIQGPSVDRSEQNEASPPVERDVVDRVTCRAGDNSCATAHADTLNRATASQPARAEHSLLRLQRQYGNRYVERVLARAKDDPAHDEVTAGIEQAIHRERGGGQQLDNGVLHQMEPALGANFSGVRVHTDTQSDSLSRSLNARAFTTGQDIFFRQGAYQPGSSTGRELIAHELTHVVQQGGDQVRRAMSVSQPSDPHEVEAEQTARAVMQREAQGPTTVVPGEHDKDKDEQHHAMASRSVGEAQRQPEAPTKEEDEEKKKHHGVMKANRSKDLAPGSADDL